MKKLLLLGFILLVLVSGFVSAEVPVLDSTFDDSVTTSDDMTAITSKLKKIINILQYIATFVAAIAAIITGIMFMTAKDPADKRHIGDRLKSIIIGLVIVVLSIPIVNLIIS